LEVTVEADAERLIELRAVVLDYLGSVGADSDTCVRALAAVHEACANVVRHAYGPEGGPLHLNGCLLGSEVEFVISDNGTPVADPNAGPGAGLGLHLMGALADDLDVEGPGPAGTRVRLSFRLNHPPDDGPDPAESH
jgi:anti-sigma regulatory factor (Ser/Thr protein kinase)